jgi:hypothetical protein
VSKKGRFIIMAPRATAKAIKSMVAIRGDIPFFS